MFCFRQHGNSTYSIFSLRMLYRYKLNNTKWSQANEPTSRIEIKSGFYINQYDAKLCERKWDAKMMKKQITAIKFGTCFPFDSIHSIHNSHLIHNQWHKRIHSIVFVRFFFGIYWFSFVVWSITRQVMLWLTICWCWWHTSMFTFLQSKDDKHDWWHLVFYGRSICSVFHRYWQIDAMQICIFHKQTDELPIPISKNRFSFHLYRPLCVLKNKNV